MKKSRRLLLLLLVMTLSLSLVLTACGGDKKPAEEKPAETEKPADDKTAEDDGGDKVLRLSGMSIETLNQHASSMSSESEVQEYIYGQLLQLVYNEEKENIEFVGYHAEDLPKTEDNITWTFKVRDDAKWTDGTPITAEDYVYSWKMLLDPKLANRNAMVLVDNVKIKNANEYFKGEVENFEDVGIKALDGNIIEITMEDETPEIDILSNFADVSTGPVYKELYEAGMNEDRTETTYGTKFEDIKSSGRYTMTEWVRDQHRKFEKNDDMPLAELFKAERIEERVISESSTRLQLFEKGELDAASVTTEYERFSEDPRVALTKGNTVWGFFVNSKSEKNPILQNKDFRQAMFYGIDRDKIAKGVFNIYESTPWYISSVPMVDWEKGTTYSESEEAKAVRPEGTGFEPDKAKELFEKAYAANGNKKIEVEIIYFEEQEDMKRMAEVTEEEYENLFGADKIDIKLRAMDPSAAYDAYGTGDFEMGIGAMSQSAFNPWSSMKIWTTDFPNKPHAFEDPKFDELQERTTTGDLKLKEKERIEALAEMEAMLIDHVPQVPIFQNNNANVYSDRLQLVTGGEYLPVVGFGLLQSEIKGL